MYSCYSTGDTLAFFSELRPQSTHDLVSISLLSPVMVTSSGTAVRIVTRGVCWSLLLTILKRRSSTMNIRLFECRPTERCSPSTEGNPRHGQARPPGCIY